MIPHIIIQISTNVPLTVECLMLDLHTDTVVLTLSWTVHWATATYWLLATTMTSRQRNKLGQHPWRKLFAVLVWRHGHSIPKDVINLHIFTTWYDILLWIYTPWLLKMLTDRGHGNLLSDHGAIIFSVVVTSARKNMSLSANHRGHLLYHRLSCLFQKWKALWTFYLFSTQCLITLLTPWANLR